MRFFCGMHRPHHAGEVPAAFISINTLRARRSPIPAAEWIMDSGGFTVLLQHGRYIETPAEYAAQVRRWATNGSGRLLAAVSQDFMCAPVVLDRCGATVAQHQAMTIERFDELSRFDVGTYLMPVLQGAGAADFAAHVRAYGERLAPGAWVAVGSIQRLSRDPRAVLEILLAIKAERPDLRLHGLGLKTTVLEDGHIRSLLASADSMAWSYAARRQGRNANDPAEAAAFTRQIEGARFQIQLPF